MRLKKRTRKKLSVAVLLILFLGSLQSSAFDHKAPLVGLTLDSPHIETHVGLRPYREGGIRLDVESAHGITLIHNYGHGGAGLTLSWGTILESIRLAGDLKGKKIAIIGGGVIGLTTAKALLDAGFEVTLYSDHFYPNNVSAVAGGLWSPVSVDMTAGSNEQKDRLTEIQKRSYELFQKLMGDTWGVRELPLFVTEEAREKSGLDLFYDLPELFNVKSHKRLPIEGVQMGGYEVKTFLIDTPIYMNKLQREVREAGATFVTRKFSSVADIAVEVGTGAVVFNCTGLGAKELVNDDKLIPVRGDLVYLKRHAGFDPSELDYLVFYGPNGTDYMFARNGEIVFGGSFEKGNGSTVPDKKACTRILGSATDFFGQGKITP